MADTFWQCPRCGWATHDPPIGIRHICNCYPPIVWADVTPRAPVPVEPAPALAPPERMLQGSVVGYRGWRIRSWQLTSTTMGDHWKPGVNEAQCKAPLLSAHDSPDADCPCGLYALARFDHGGEWWLSADVVGAVEAWADEDSDGQDRFFVHSTGFRAQYAKVILLAVSDDYSAARNAAIRALAAEHGADVCDRKHLEVAATEHGQLIPDEWLAWAKEDESSGAETAWRYGVGGYVGASQLHTYQQACRTFATVIITANTKPR